MGPTRARRLERVEEPLDRGKPVGGELRHRPPDRRFYGRRYGIAHDAHAGNGLLRVAAITAWTEGPVKGGSPTSIS